MGLGRGYYGGGDGDGDGGSAVGSVCMCLLLIGRLQDVVTGKKSIISENRKDNGWYYPYTVCILS